MKKIFIGLSIILIVVLILFFIRNNYKSSKSGNNISSKSPKEIEQYILNINSYEAEVEIQVNSNKNQNKYRAKQEYVKEHNLYKQVMEEPKNIEGVSFTYSGADLKIENKNLNLSKLYEDYNYMGSNDLSLARFIEDYNTSEEKKLSEKGSIITLEVKMKNGNKYKAYKKLYFDKNQGIPTKLEIQDVSQNTVVYILYNEIKINNLQKEDMIAFKLSSLNVDI